MEPPKWWRPLAADQSAPPFNALLLEALITVYELYFELYTDLVPLGKKIRMNIFGEKDI